MQESFARLFQSSDLGILIANPERVIEANDAFLRMIEYTREELTTEGIDWRTLTPPEYAKADQRAVEQLRTLGVAVPFEKEFILRSGRRVDFIIGAVRLAEDPLLWACYTIDRTETKRLREAEHELLARTRVINQLAHELNNPLAALAFLLHLAQMNEGLPEDHCELLRQADNQLMRVSETVREVLAQTEKNGVIGS